MLSSRDVAFAASACLAVVPPPTVPLTFRQLAGSPRVIRVRWDRDRPTGAASQNYRWSATMAPNSVGTVTVSNPGSRETTLRRNIPGLRPRDQKWVAGDQCNIRVQVTWRCAVRDAPNVVATYDCLMVARLGTTWPGVGTLSV